MKANIGLRLVKMIVAAIDYRTSAGANSWGSTPLSKGTWTAWKAPPIAARSPRAGRVNAADFAKVKSIGWSHVSRRRPLIIGLGFSAGHKTKTVGSRKYEPGAGFGAAREVALFRSHGDVNINLEANRAA
jgi:hypothetical protein